MVALGQMLIEVRDQTAILGPGAPPGPRVGVQKDAGPRQRGLGLLGIALAPILFWELSVGLWMTFKGFNASRPRPLTRSPVAPRRNPPR